MRLKVEVFVDEHGELHWVDPVVWAESNGELGSGPGWRLLGEAYIEFTEVVSSKLKRQLQELGELTT